MRHCIVATLGPTPQVLTEAVYYYRRQLGIQVSEIQVFTTTVGVESLKRDLLGNGGAMARLCKDLRIAPRELRFDTSHIHVLAGSDGSAITDVRDSSDVTAAAEQMLKVLRRLCLDRNRTVHAMVAGGRKVMGVVLHTLMQLVGRPHDRIFHILVAPALEAAIKRGQHKDFYYPRGPLTLDGVHFQPDQLLKYVEVPFLCLASRESVSTATTFADLVTARRQEAMFFSNQPTIILDCRTTEARIEQVRIRFRPDEFVWYYTLARRAVEGLGPVDVDALCDALVFANGRLPRIEASAPNSAMLAQVLDDFVRAYWNVFGDEGKGPADFLERFGRGAKDTRRFRELKSRTNSRFKRALGAAARIYKIVEGRGPHVVLLPPERIRFVGERSGNLVHPSST